MEFSLNSGTDLWNLFELVKLCLACFNKLIGEISLSSLFQQVLWSNLRYKCSCDESLLNK